MRCACLMGGVCGAGVIRCNRGSMPVMGRLVRGWRFSVKSATYLVLLDVVGSGCGVLRCRVRAL